MDITKETGQLGKEKLGAINDAFPNAIQMRSGKLIDIFNIDPNVINIKDLAHAVSQLCRWCGHCSEYFSVAQHLVLCSKFGRTPIEKMELLFHDLSEGVMCDVAKPIKKRLTQYVELEDILISEIYKKFGMKFPLSPYVHEIDRKMLYIEYENLFLRKRSKIRGWGPKKAERKFLREYKKINREIVKDL